MKRLFCLLLVLLLPLFAAAESPVTITSNTALNLPGENPGISDCLPLPDGGALLNVLTTTELDGSPADTLWLIRLDTTGNIRWQTRYHLFTRNKGFDRYTLSLDADSVTVALYSNLIGNETCTRTSMVFDLATGRQLGKIDVSTIPANDVPTVTHCGDYRVEEFFGDYNLPTVRTRITHIPTGNTAEYMLFGNLHWTTFGGKLLSFCTGLDGGYYWMYDETCQVVVERAPTLFGEEFRPISHSVVYGDWLCLFVWLNEADPDVRTYAVFPMDASGLFGDNIALFTLPEGHSLADVAVCGEGFLLTEYYPWEWQQPARSALSYLPLGGERVILEPELVFPRGDTAQLLPGTDAAPVCVILRDANDASHHLLTYSN